MLKKNKKKQAEKENEIKLALEAEIAEDEKVINNAPFKLSREKHVIGSPKATSINYICLTNKRLLYTDIKKVKVRKIKLKNMIRVKMIDDKKNTLEVWTPQWKVQLISATSDKEATTKLQLQIQEHLPHKLSDKKEERKKVREIRKYRTKPPYRNVWEALGPRAQQGILGGTSRRLVEKLEATLHEAEDILFVCEISMQVISSVVEEDDDKWGLFCVTDSRIVTAGIAGIMFDSGSNSIPLTSITSVSDRFILGRRDGNAQRSGLRIKTVNMELILWGANSERKKLITNLLLQKMEEIRKPKIEVKVDQPVNSKSETALDRAAALKQFKELLDSGVINQEEFEAEKSRILKD